MPPPPPRRAASLVEIDRELALRSLKHFAKQAWHVLEPTTPLEWSWHLDAICSHVQAVLMDWKAVVEAQARGEVAPPQRIRNLAIAVPPGTAKSRFVSVFAPCWFWLHHPSWRSIFISGNPKVALRDADFCLMLLRSKWYQETFRPRWTLLNGDRAARSDMKTDRGGRRQAFSSRSIITGDRGDSLFIDDPDSANDVASEAIRESTHHWWDSGAGNRLNDLRYGTRVLIQQRLHNQDLTGHVTRVPKGSVNAVPNNGWETLTIPQEFRPEVAKVSAIGWKDPRTKPGELLFESRFPAPVLAAEKLRLGPSGYSAQHQQDPVDTKGSRFQQIYFRYWEKTSVPGVIRLLRRSGEILVQLGECQIFAVMDPAGAEKKVNTKPCYTVIMVWAATPTGDMVLLHVYREQASTPEVEQAAWDVHQRWQPNYIGIERNGIGLGIVQHLQARGLPIMEIEAEGSKEARSETAEIRMAAGKVFFENGAHYLHELESELLLFPNGDFVDQADVVSHSARLVGTNFGPPTQDSSDPSPAEDPAPGVPSDPVAPTPVVTAAAPIAGRYRNQF